MNGRFRLQRQENLRARREFRAGYPTQTLLLGAEDRSRATSHHRHGIRPNYPAESVLLHAQQLRHPKKIEQWAAGVRREQVLVTGKIERQEIIALGHVVEKVAVRQQRKTPALVVLD